MNSIHYIAVNLLSFVIGQWLVTRGHWGGFLVWCAANLYSVVVCITTGIPETSCLFAAYFAANFWSLRSWLAQSRGKAAPTEPGHSFA